MRKVMNENDEFFCTFYFLHFYLLWALIKKNIRFFCLIFTCIHSLDLIPDYKKINLVWLLKHNKNNNLYEYICSGKKMKKRFTIPFTVVCDRYACALKMETINVIKRLVKFL